MVKRAFSLTEALIVMTIVSVFFAVATKVVTKKEDNKLPEEPHGYYECYTNNYTTSYTQTNMRNGIENIETNLKECTFNPPLSVAFYTVITYINDELYETLPNIENNPTYKNTIPKITKPIKISLSNFWGAKWSIDDIDLDNNNNHIDSNNYIRAYCAKDQDNPLDEARCEDVIGHLQDNEAMGLLIIW